jgi:hypothetical protein
MSALVLGRRDAPGWAAAAPSQRAWTRRFARIARPATPAPRKVQHRTGPAGTRDAWSQTLQSLNADVRLVAWIEVKRDDRQIYVYGRERLSHGNGRRRRSQERAKLVEDPTEECEACDKRESRGTGCAANLRDLVRRSRIVVCSLFAELFFWLWRLCRGNTGCILEGKKELHDI